MGNALITFLIFLCPLYSYGQTSFGIKGGINHNNIVIENAPFLPVSTFTPSVGFHLGVLAKIDLSNKFSLNPELVFVQRGANSSNNYFLQGVLLSGNSGDSRINLNYLEIPLLLSYNPIKLLSFEAGPNAGFRLSAKEVSDNGKSDVSDNFKSFDFGINAGIKLTITSRIVMVARYYHGLNSVVNFPEVQLDTSPSGKIKTFQFGLHYLLRK